MLSCSCFCDFNCGANVPVVNYVNNPTFQTAETGPGWPSLVMKQVQFLLLFLAGCFFHDFKYFVPCFGSIFN